MADVRPIPEEAPVITAIRLDPEGKDIGLIFWWSLCVDSRSTDDKNMARVVKVHL